MKFLALFLFLILNGCTLKPVHLENNFTSTPTKHFNSVTIAVSGYNLKENNVLSNALFDKFNEREIESYLIDSKTLLNEEKSLEEVLQIINAALEKAFKESLKSESNSAKILIETNKIELENFYRETIQKAKTDVVLMVSMDPILVRDYLESEIDGTLRFSIIRTAKLHLQLFEQKTGNMLWEGNVQTEWEGFLYKKLVLRNLAKKTVDELIDARFFTSE